MITSGKLLEIWSALRGEQARVLLYHSISDSPSDPLSVSPDVLCLQMEWLRENGIRVISSQALVSAIQGGQVLCRTVLLTFDDALTDFYIAAVPILSDFHYPGTVFVPTGRVGQASNWGTKSPTRPVMTELQLKEVAALGFEVGSHTVNHASLTDIDHSTLKSELVESLLYLRGKIDIDSISLAYPFGRGGPRWAMCCWRLKCCSPMACRLTWKNSSAVC